MIDFADVIGGYGISFSSDGSIVLNWDSLFLYESLVCNIDVSGNVVVVLGGVLDPPVFDLYHFCPHLLVVSLGA